MSPASEGRAPWNGCLGCLASHRPWAVGQPTAPEEVASLKASWSSGQGIRWDIWRLGAWSSLPLLCWATLSRLLGLSVPHLPPSPHLARLPGGSIRGWLTEPGFYSTSGEPFQPRQGLTGTRRHPSSGCHRPASEEKGVRGSTASQRGKTSRTISPFEDGETEAREHS